MAWALPSLEEDAVVIPSASGPAPAAGQGTLLAGRYRLAERRHEYDRSAEWRATDEILGRSVAVHIFTPGSPHGAQVMAAARAASRVSDPRLARVFDADDRADPPLIVTEWPSGTGGEVTITGLGIAAAPTGAQATDPVLADTRGLARLLYAALTGHWPGEGQDVLPPAPRPGGPVARSGYLRPGSPLRLSAARQPAPAICGPATRSGYLRPGIPDDIDSVTCRALSGQARNGRPAILGPAQLAVELAAVTRPGPASGPPPGAAPAPTRPARTMWLARTTSLARTTWLAPPRLRAVRRPIRLAAVIIALAVLAGGGWLAVREVTARHRPSGAGRASSAAALTPASAAAFGPWGRATATTLSLRGSLSTAAPATAWHTQWYATPGFGNLKPGTGLLLDLGRPVTVTPAQITLGAITGADLQLRAGGEPVLADLRPVASATDAGGVVTMRPCQPGEGPLPAPVVHPAAAGLLRHVRRIRLRHPAARQHVSSSRAAACLSTPVIHPLSRRPPRPGSQADGAVAPLPVRLHGMIFLPNEPWFMPRSPARTPRA